MRLNDLTGNKFGRLTVISRADDYISPSGKKLTCWNCICECGNTTTVRAPRLKNGTTRSCGCLQKEYAKSAGTHGDSAADSHYHALYMVYQNMKQRVYHPVHTNDAKIYGNLTIDDEWMGKHGYENFKKWSLENGYQEGLSIDRIDGAKGYSPDNCRWTTAKVQVNNRRNMVFLKVGEREMNYTDWAKTLGISPTTVGTWARNNGKEWAQDHIEAILNGDKPLRTKRHTPHKARNARAKFLTVDGVTHNYAEWQEILGKDRYCMLISRWVTRHGEEYAITRIRESLNGTEINRRASRVTYLTVNGETHNLREWDAICGLRQDTVSRWCRRNGEDYAVNAIQKILNGEPIERVTGRHLSASNGKKKYLTVDGDTHTISEWHEIIGYKRYSNTISYWIKQGGEDFAISKIRDRLQNSNNVS